MVSRRGGGGYVIPFRKALDKGFSQIYGLGGGGVGDHIFEKIARECTHPGYKQSVVWQRRLHRLHMHSGAGRIPEKCCFVGRGMLYLFAISKKRGLGGGRRPYFFGNQGASWVLLGCGAVFADYTGHQLGFGRE